MRLAPAGGINMDALPSDHLIRDEATLAELYGEPSAGAIAKEIPYLHPHYQAMIAASPFVTIATSGPAGLDVSPRGDPAGFVTVVDEHTLLIPDRRGNNRADTLRNIIHDPRIALLFLIPGVGETLRVNGRAEISVATDLLARFEFRGTLPRSVIVVHVETVYFQCPKALVRSELWNPEKHISRKALPSTGTILADITAGRVGGEQYDREYPDRLRKTLY
jgi:PPOX class probable FMN-dependent enzyme